MMDQEISRKLIEYAREDGYEWWAKYMELFGVDAPIMECVLSPRDQERREEIAKACVEQGKPAKELGLYEAVPDGWFK